jgi:hypothetical protein
MKRGARGFGAGFNLHPRSISGSDNQATWLVLLEGACCKTAVTARWLICTMGFIHGGFTPLVHSLPEASQLRDSAGFSPDFAEHRNLFLRRAMSDYIGRPRVGNPRMSTVPGVVTGLLRAALALVSLHGERDRPNQPGILTELGGNDVVVEASVSYVGCGVSAELLAEFGAQ